MFRINAYYNILDGSRWYQRNDASETIYNRTIVCANRVYYNFILLYYYVFLIL